MTVACQIARPVASRVANRSSVEIAWGKTFKQIFPEKTAPNVASLTRTQIRAIELVIENPKRGLSGRALINLLRSPIGGKILAVILGDAPPDWRTREERLIRIAQLQTEIDQHKASLENLQKRVG